MLKNPVIIMMRLQVFMVANIKVTVFIYYYVQFLFSVKLLQNKPAKTKRLKDH
jgi:hypothetical protein